MRDRNKKEVDERTNKGTLVKEKRNEGNERNESTLVEEIKAKKTKTMIIYVKEITKGRNEKMEETLDEREEKLSK